MNNRNGSQETPLATQELGTGENGHIVVGLHGLSSSGHSLIPIVRPLITQGTRVVLPDLLGHGSSPWPPHLPYDVDDHFAALEEWAQIVVGASPVWLVGNSMGALLAMAWAARSPTRVRGIIVISAPLFASTAEARAHLTQGDAMARLILTAPKLARVLCRCLCGKSGLGRRLSTTRQLHGLFGTLMLRAYGSKHVLPITETAQAKAFLLDGLTECWLHSWESLYGSLLHCIVEYRAWSDLEQIRMAGIPMLFLHGDRDAVAPIARVRQAAAIGRWTQQEYAWATHTLYITHTQAVSDEIAHFLSIDPSDSYG